MRKSGFTLVELLISLVLISIISTSILQIFVTGTAWTSRAGSRTKAIRTVQKAAELIYSQSERTGASVSSVVNSITVSGITGKTVTDRASTTPTDKRIDLGSGRYASGSEVTVVSTINGHQESITIFVPKNP